MTDAGCGGCRGLGNHRRYCPRHPEYHPWRQLADRAADIGDTIGSNDPGIANKAYALAAQIRGLMIEHPYRPLSRVQYREEGKPDE